MFVKNCSCEYSGCSLSVPTVKQNIPFFLSAYSAWKKSNLSSTADKTLSYKCQNPWGLKVKQWEPPCCSIRPWKLLMCGHKKVKTTGYSQLSDIWTRILRKGEREGDRKNELNKGVWGRLLPSTPESDVVKLRFVEQHYQRLHVLIVFMMLVIKSRCFSEFP